MQRVDLPFVGQQFDNNNRAGESQCYSDVKRDDWRHTHEQSDQVAHDRGKEHLSEPGCQGDRAHRSDNVQIQLQPDNEQQQRDTQPGK